MKIKKEISYIISYICNNKIISLVILYAIIAISLKSFAIINITVPCLWTTIFGHRCPGCGLTTAAIELLRFHPISAFKTNPLIVIIIPAFLYYLIIDYIKFRKKKLSRDKEE